MNAPDLEPIVKPEQDEVDQSDTPDEIGIITFPVGTDASWWVKKFQHLNDGHKKWFEKELLNIEDNYKIVELKQVAGTLPNGTIIPGSTAILETMNSKIVSSLVPRETFVSAIARDPVNAMAGDFDKQETISDFVNETITNVPDFSDKCDEMFKTLLIEDVTFAECKWTIEQKQELTSTRGLDPMIPQVSDDPTQPPPLQPIVSVQPTSYDLGYPDFSPLSMRMCAWDPRVKDKVSNSAWFRKREMVSINGLFALQKAGVIENVDAIVQKSNKSMTPENPTDPDARQSQAVDGKQLPSVGWDDGVWELDTWWVDAAWKDETGEYQTGKFEAWVVGGDTVVKFRPNILVPQRIPVVTIKMSRKPGQLLAMGPIDVVKQMQKAVNNDRANLEQLIKNAAYSPTFYTPSSGIDGRRVSLQSNSMIPVLDINGIKRFEPAVEAIDIVMKDIEFLLDQMREATAANDQSQGIQQATGDTTATEAQILAQGSNSRFQYIIESINSSTFANGIAPEFLMLWKQFGEPGQMVVKDGSNDGKGYQIQPEDLQGCYIFKPVLAQTEQAKMSRFGQLKGIADAIGQIPPGMLTDNTGQVKQLDIYGFLTQTLLPLANVQPRGMFKNAPPPPMPPMGAPGMPPGPGGPPQGPPPMSGSPAPGIPNLAPPVMQ